MDKFFLSPLDRSSAAWRSRRAFRVNTLELLSNPGASHSDISHTCRRRSPTERTIYPLPDQVPLGRGQLPADARRFFSLALHPQRVKKEDGNV